MDAHLSNSLRMNSTSFGVMMLEGWYLQLTCSTRSVGRNRKGKSIRIYFTITLGWPHDEGNLVQLGSATCLAPVYSKVFGYQTWLLWPYPGINRVPQSIPYETHYWNIESFVASKSKPHQETQRSQSNL